MTESGFTIESAGIRGGRPAFRARKVGERHDWLLRYDGDRGDSLRIVRELNGTSVQYCPFDLDEVEDGEVVAEPKGDSAVLAQARELGVLLPLLQQLRPDITGISTL